jgi:predicted AAA+ superfamily ATPase
MKCFARRASIDCKDLIFDEVHYFPEWTQEIKAIYDLYPERSFPYFVMKETGTKNFLNRKNLS